MIPGPQEPKQNVNSFLQPLVDELIDLWDGVLLKTSDGRTEKFRGALLALSSDIPATRKCGGFIGHNGKRGMVLMYSNELCVLLKMNIYIYMYIILCVCVCVNM